MKTERPGQSEGASERINHKPQKGKTGEDKNLPTNRVTDILPGGNDFSRRYGSAADFIGGGGVSGGAGSA